VSAIDGTAEGVLLALCGLAETLIARGLVDRDLAIFRAQNHAAALPPDHPRSQTLTAFASMLAERRGARLLPSA
jgi:hypothetical protein